MVRFVTGGGEDRFKLLLCGLSPLACIWFGEAVGGFTGPAGTMGTTASAAGRMVRIPGWVNLLLPVVFVILQVMIVTPTLTARAQRVKP